MSAESLGEILRRARVAKGVTDEEMAQRARLGIDFIRAVESDRFDEMPGEVYAKGLLRDYARWFDLDASRLIELYDGLDITPSDRTPRMISMPLTRRRSVGRMALYGALGILTILVALVYLVFGGEIPESDEQRDFLIGSIDESSDSAGSLAPAGGDSFFSNSLPSEPDLGADRVYRAGATLEPTTPEPGAAGVAPPSEEADAAAAGAAPYRPEEEARLTEEESAPVEHELLIKADADSWLKVVIDRDRTRDVILRAGEQARWKARASFVLSIGNLKGVKLYLDGKPYSPPRDRGNVLINLPIELQRVKKETDGR